MKKAIAVSSSLLFLLSCSVRKSEPRILVLPPPPSIPKIYACEFKEGTFEGVLPCFGNDCTESGVPLTTFKFQNNEKLVRIIERESGVRDSVVGKWRIDENCLLTVAFDNQIFKFFKYHKETEKIELLNDAQQSFNGTLNEHCFISRVK